jgi:hypothetical protein
VALTLKDNKGQRNNSDAHRCSEIFKNKNKIEKGYSRLIPLHPSLHMFVSCHCCPAACTASPQAVERQIYLGVTNMKLFCIPMPDGRNCATLGRVDIKKTSS